MIESMLRTFEDPHARHAVLVHFPIVLGALGVIPVIVLAFLRFKSRVGSAVCVVWFACAMVGLGLAAGAGEEAYERVENTQPLLSQAEEAALEEHESLGEGAWLWALPAVLLAGATFVPKKPVRLGAGVLLIAAAGILGGFVAVTGHTGGKLVYDYGLGVPPRGQAADSATGSSPIRSDEYEEHDDD